jgi:hypothetical protein
MRICTTNGRPKESELTIKATKNETKTILGSRRCFYSYLLVVSSSWGSGGNVRTTDACKWMEVKVCRGRKYSLIHCAIPRSVSLYPTRRLRAPRKETKQTKTKTKTKAARLLNALISYKSVTNIHPPLYPPHGPPLYHFFSGSNMAR